MCGRFTLAVDPGDLQAAFPGIELPAVGIAPRYNISPSQPVLAITQSNKKYLDFFTWGLIPAWAKDPSIGARMINARSETLAEKPSFKNAFRRRRCLIPASGFYEWRSDPITKMKEPIYIYLKNEPLFAFAGLWETWQSSDGSEIRSCTIITTQANAFIKPIHDRMPVIIPPSNYYKWLTTSETNIDSLSDLFLPYSANEFNCHQVSRLVNNPLNELDACIKKL